MTEEQLQQIEEIEKLFQATGITTPFTACHGGDCKCHMVWADDHLFTVCVDVDNEDYTMGEGFTEEGAKANTKFAAAALNALPLLRAQQAEIERLWDAINNSHGKDMVLNYLEEKAEGTEI